MSVKKRVKKAAGYRCEKCNAKPTNTSSIQAHHIVPESVGGKTSEENLSVLCSWCHKFAPDNATLVLDYEAVFEDYVRTGMRPELDLMVFGMQFGTGYGLSEDVISNVQMTFESMTTYLTKKEDSQSGIVYPDTYWLIGALFADHGDVRENLPPRFKESFDEFESVLAD